MGLGDQWKTLGGSGVEEQMRKVSERANSGGMTVIFVPALGVFAKGTVRESPAAANAVK